jgi:phospholipid/cholesterol/gamma-HCH transport system substrate-binding protein
MESNRQTQIRVGVFLGLGLIAALVSILALGGDKSLFRSYIRVNANLPQVQGLSAGSIISLTGVTIGNIEEIKFGQAPGALTVVMKIDQKYQNQIPKDSTVDIRTQGALGDKYVYISPGDLAKGFVENQGYLEADKSKDIMAIIDEKGGEAGKIFDVVSEALKLMKSINSENRAEKIMANFTEASADLKEVSKQAKALIGEIKDQNNVASVADSMKKMNSILTKIDKGQGTLGALINDPTLHEQLKAVFGGSPRKQYFQSILQNSIEK